GRIGGFERNHLAFAAEPLQRGFRPIDQGYDDIAILDPILLAYDDDIAIVNASLDHRVALDFKCVMFALSGQHAVRDRDVMRYFRDRLYRDTGRDPAHQG